MNKFLSIFIILLILTACKNDENSESISREGELLLTSIELQGTVIETYSYDDQKRLVMRVNLEDIDVTAYNIEYEGNSSRITTVTELKDNEINYTYTYNYLSPNEIRIDRIPGSNNVSGDLPTYYILKSNDGLVTSLNFFNSENDDLNIEQLFEYDDIGNLRTFVFDNKIGQSVERLNVINTDSGKKASPIIAAPDGLEDGFLAEFAGLTTSKNNIIEYEVVQSTGTFGPFTYAVEYDAEGNVVAAADLEFIYTRL